jgi:hypothetical protein
MRTQSTIACSINQINEKNRGIPFASNSNLIIAAVSEELHDSHVIERKHLFLIANKLLMDMQMEKKRE